MNNAIWTLWSHSGLGGGQEGRASRARMALSGFGQLDIVD